MIILAIVGSVLLEGNEEAAALIEEMLDKYKPDKVISGGAVGIDKMGIAAAKARGIDTTEYEPEVQKWDPPGKIGFKKRNIQIANECTHLVRIISSRTTTFGSGYTMEYAKSQNKPTENHIIEQK